MLALWFQENYSSMPVVQYHPGSQSIFEVIVLTRFLMNGQECVHSHIYPIWIHQHP
jgi:hypothetical protein